MTAASESASAIKRLPRLVAIICVALFIALLIYGLISTGPSGKIDQQLAKHRSTPAPGFSLEVLEPGVLPTRLKRTVGAALADGRLSLAELRGTPVILNFWASWCIPCREEAPRLRRGWQRWGKRGVLFVGLDMQDIRSDARDFLREFRISYPSIRDPGKDVATRYGATGIPETYFLTAQSRVVGHVIGAVSDQQLNSGVVAARSGRPVGTASGGERRKTR